jgi:hypothetical protein
VLSALSRNDVSAGLRRLICEQMEPWFKTQNRGEIGEKIIKKTRCEAFFLVK